jgi:hypothetical protein
VQGENSDRSSSSNAHKGSYSSVSFNWYNVLDRAVSVAVYELIPYLKEFFNFATSAYNLRIA